MCGSNARSYKLSVLVPDSIRVLRTYTVVFNKPNTTTIDCTNVEFLSECSTIYVCSVVHSFLGSVVELGSIFAANVAYEQRSNSQSRTNTDTDAF